MRCLDLITVVMFVSCNKITSDVMSFFQNKKSPLNLHHEGLQT